MRLLGALICLSVGGGSIYAGYHIGPIVGWFIMFIGGLLALFGTWRSLAMSKEGLELEELTEKMKKEIEGRDFEVAKELAEEMLNQGVIEDYEVFNWVCDILSKGDNYFKSKNLLDDLWKLKKEHEKG